MTEYNELQGENMVPDEHLEQITAIAKMCHAVLSAYCLALREEQAPWSELSDEARDKIIGRVAFIILNPDAKAQANHDVWMLKMLSNGWKYGKVNDTANKKHSSLVPFHHLPTEQQAKDHIFNAIVRQAIDS
jgi:hypothetical protein